MSGYDAIVIGSGSVGSPTAYFLSEAGLRVLVIDELASSGQGQNKAAIGGVRATHSDPAKITLCSQSLGVFSAWEESTGTDIGWKRGGYCFPVYGEREEGMLKRILPVQKAHGLEIDWCGDVEIRRHVPGINPRGLVGGTFSPNDGQVSPLLASESFTREAARLGAEFRFRESVTGLLTEGDPGSLAVVGVRTDGGPSGKGPTEHRAPVVVNAAGARASAICRMAGLDIPVVPDSHEAGITAPVRPFLGPLVVDLRPGPEGRTSNFYFGQNSEGQVIFCFTPSTLFKGEDRRSTGGFMPTIARRLVDLVPRFRNLTVRRVWRGLYPMTHDGVPVVGADPCVEGFFMGIGMCGQGLMLGPGVAVNIASLVTRGSPAMDPEAFATLAPTRDLACGREMLK